MFTSHNSNYYINKVTVPKVFVSFLVCFCLLYVTLVNLRLPGYQQEPQIMANNTKVSFYVNDPKDGKQITTFEKQTKLVQHKTKHLIINESTYHQSVNITIPSKAEKEKLKNVGDTKNKKRIKIVVYFPRQVRISTEISKLKMSKCENNNCFIQQIYVEINGSIVDADAIVVQGNNMPNFLPARKDAEQVFVFLNNEPPMYIQRTNLNKNTFNNYFNWTMTYRTDSDIPLLYGEIVRERKTFEENVNITMKRNERYKTDINTAVEKNYSFIFRYKSKNAFWIVSHCLTKSKRENYIYQMKNFTEIDQFGRCNNKSVTSKALDRMSKQYKFYLAFENTFCNDYITEKVFNWFASDVVLVVRGGCDYSKFLPEGTYIDANKFSTPVHLAKYLTKLGRNERGYIRFLKKKDEYHVIRELEMVQLAFCNLCHRLNTIYEHRKSVANVYKWWQVNACWKPKDL